MLPGNRMTDLSRSMAGRGVWKTQDTPGLQALLELGSDHPSPSHVTGKGPEAASGNEAVACQGRPSQCHEQIGGSKGQARILLHAISLLGLPPMSLQTWHLNTADISSSPVLEPRSSESRCPQGCAPSERAREEPFPAACSFWGLPVFLG